MLDLPKEGEPLSSVTENAGDVSVPVFDLIEGAIAEVMPTGSVKQNDDGFRDSKSLKSILRRFWRWIFPMEFSDFAMLALTGAIAYSALTGGKDTSRIAVATEHQSKSAESVAKSAGRQVDAAVLFAAAADKINTNINNAVSKLNLQASQAARLAKDSESANQLLEKQTQIAVGSSRPVLEIFELGPKEGSPPAFQVIERDTTQFQFKVRNSGVSDAINIRYRLSGPNLIDTNKPAKYQLKAPMLDLWDFSTAKIEGSIPSVIGHGETRRAIPVTTASLPRAYPSSLENGEYYVGLLTWDDPIGFGHWKRVFCIVAGDVDVRGGVGDCGLDFDVEIRDVVTTNKKDKVR